MNTVSRNKLPDFHVEKRDIVTTVHVKYLQSLCQCRLLEKFQIVHSETMEVGLKDNDSDLSYIFQRRHIKDLKTKK